MNSRTNEISMLTRLLVFTMIVLTIFAFGRPAAAANYVLQAPAGMNTFIDRNGGSHNPDANGHVTVTDINLIQNYLSAGFILKAARSTASHNFGAAHVDWTLSTSDNGADILSVTNANAAVNVIANPVAGKEFLVVNGCGYNATVKASGQTGVTVANGTSVFLRGTGTDFAAAGLSAAVAASTSAAGIVELATDAETVTGTDTARSVTPSGLTARLANPGEIGTTPAAAHFTSIEFGSLTAKSHDYAGVHADWTLSAAEARGGSFATTNADQAANAILPAGFLKVFHVNNTSGQAVTWKYSASTGVAVANNKQAVLFGDGTEVKTVVAAY